MTTFTQKQCAVELSIQGENDKDDVQKASATAVFFVYAPDYVMIDPGSGWLVGTSVYPSDISTKQFSAKAYWSGTNGIREEGRGDDLECPNAVITWTVIEGDATIDESGLLTAGPDPGHIVVRASTNPDEESEGDSAELEIITPTEGDILEKGCVYNFKANIKGGTDDLKGEWDGHTEEIDGDGEPGKDDVVFKNEKTVDHVSMAEVTFNKCGTFRVNCQVLKGEEGTTGIEDPLPPTITVIEPNDYQVELAIREAPGSGEIQENDVMCVSAGKKKHRALLFVKLTYTGEDESEQQTIHLSVEGNDCVRLSKETIKLMPGKTKRLLITSGSMSSTFVNDINIEAKIGHVVEDTEDLTVVRAEIEVVDIAKIKHPKYLCRKKSREFRAQVIPDIGLAKGDFNWHPSKWRRLRINGARDEKEVSVTGNRGGKVSIVLKIRVGGEWCSGVFLDFTVLEVGSRDNRLPRKHHTNKFAWVGKYVPSDAGDVFGHKARVLCNGSYIRLESSKYGLVGHCPYTSSSWEAYYWMDKTNAVLMRLQFQVTEGNKKTSCDDDEDGNRDGKLETWEFCKEDNNGFSVVYYIVVNGEIAEEQFDPEDSCAPDDQQRP